MIGRDGMGRARTGAGLQNVDAHSPGPWRVEESISGNPRVVVDANGREVAMCFGEVSDEVDQANAALIVKVLNRHFKRRKK